MNTHHFSSTHRVTAGIRWVCLVPIFGCLASLSVPGSTAGKMPVLEKDAKPSRVAERISVQLTDPAAPFLKLHIEASTASDTTSSADSREPLALAAADFDEDGVPDLATGFGSSDAAGSVSVQRGNVDAIYPNSAEARARRQRGEFSAAAFLPEIKTVAIPEAADFVGAGDFDADGHWDIVATRRGGDKLYWMRGDGHGGFSEPKIFYLPGAVTCLVTGEMNRPDGLTDIAVGVLSDAGPQVWVFESPEGAMRSAPESFNLPAPATALVMGQLDDDSPLDLAVATGNEVMIVHGRDRKLSLGEEQRANVAAAQVSHNAFGSAVVSVAVGDFAGDTKKELAVLTADGNVRVLERDGVFQTNGAMTLTLAQSMEDGAFPTGLLATKTSSLPKDDLLVFGGTNLVQVLTSSGARMNLAASLISDREVTAVLPMRLNSDALKDLVLVDKSGSNPLLALTAPAATFVVNIPGNTNDKTPGDGVCADDLGNCSFSAAIQESNAHAGTDAINFNLPGPGPFIVTPNFGQSFDDPVTIDGTTQPNGRVEIVANGYYPVIFEGGNSVLRGVATYGNSWAILLFSSGNVIEGNYIGFRADGSKPVGFGANGSGIAFGGAPYHASGGNNLIGGTTAQARNVISNCANALYLSGALAGNRVQGNYIGTNVAGTSALPNNNAITVSAPDVLIGGTVAGAGNLISGNGPSFNGTAILINPAAAVIQGNLIGTTADGTQPLANNARGIDVGGDKAVTIGGTTAAARYVIAANGEGIRIGQEGAGTCAIQGNFIGTNAAGTGALPNLGAGIYLTGSGSVVGGTATGAGNLISGNGDDGVRFDGLSGSYAGANNNIIQGNLIGTDVTGTLALPNFGDGVEIAVYARGNLIGGSATGARNVISGNRDNGINYTFGGTSNPNRAEGNFIGLDRTGVAPLGNGQGGIFVGGDGNYIGGTAAGSGNVIAFNRGPGIGSRNFPISAAVLSNSIYSNVGMGIDAGSDGPNRYSGNYGERPVITSASTSGSQTTVTGKLRTFTDGGLVPHKIQFFANRSSDPTGYGEGETFVGETTINAGSLTEVSFNATITPAVPPGRYLSAVSVGSRSANDPNSVVSSEFSFNARVTGDTTPENTPLRLELITPVLGGDGGVVTATIIGEGIIDGVTAVLRRAGQPDIVGAGAITDGYSMVTRFNLTGQAQGPWDVVVTRPDGTSATLPGAFTIQPTRAARGFVEIMGRSRVGPHRNSTFYVSYGNTGNVDIYDVLLLVHFPKGVSVKALSGLGFPPDLLPGHGLEGESIVTPTETLVPVWFYVLPANFNRSMTFVVNLQDKIAAPASFDLKAELLLPPPSEAEFSRTGDLAAMQAWFGPKYETNSFFIALLAAELADTEAQFQQSPPAGFVTQSGKTTYQEVHAAGSGIKPRFDDLDRRGAFNDAMKRKVFPHALDQGFIPGAIALGIGIALGIAALGLGITPLGIAAAVVSTAFSIWGIVSTGESAQAAVAYYRCYVDNSHDPNEMIGPTGAGTQGYISGEGRFGYSVFFENKATATAPAQNVVVTDKLDTSKFDLSTFSFGPIRIGESIVVAPPVGQKTLSMDVDLRPSKNLIVRIIGTVDSLSGLVTWNFQAIDPATGQPPEDISVGFLPPNVNGTEGEGSVLFNIAPKAGFTTGTILSNKATIVFDGNPPLDTNTWLNTIDNSPPVSQVQPLAATQSSTHFQVSWSGSDSGSGISTYTIFVSENGGPYGVWLGNTTLTTAFFDGNPNSSYSFYSVAHDGAGNVEATPVLPDATVQALPSGQLLNIATRLRVQTGDNVLIGGLIVTGTDSKRVIIRGIGPSLASFGITDALGDTTLELFQGSTLLQSNDNWKLDQRAEIEATGLAPKNDLESAIVRTLAPGNYTAILRGKNNLTGIGLVEVYDLDQAANSKLGNIATRGFVDTGDNVMIGGVIAGGNNNSAARVLVRALGPSLQAVGVAGALLDPTLELRDANGVLLIYNDNWKDSQQPEIQATNLAPTDELESAILTTLPAGAYTAIMRGKENTTGVGLVEVYNLD